MLKGEKKKVTCQTGLKKNIISRHIFNKEIKLCQQLSKENGGKCGWGKCKDCGVVPLLYKLHKGELLEKPGEIKKVKDKELELSR